MSTDVAILIVSHDDADELPGCLAAVAALDPAPRELAVVDCASRDDSVELAQRSWPSDLPGEVAALEDNRGFAGGMNEAFARTTASWVLTLNPDARLEPDFLGRLLEPVGSVPGLTIGAVTGRLVRLPSASGAVRLDAAGMYLVPTWRHLDRASGAPERGQLARTERVFGGTGAATLFRRRAVTDVAIDGAFFDPLFHTFREDAELCFRLRERGWEIVYAPLATAVHRRFSLPERRRAMPAIVNYHSLKNRYLLRAYHQTVPNLLWTLPFTLWRDLLALGYVLLAERASLPAYAWLWRQRRVIWRRRRAIQSRRTEPWWRLDGWFLRAARPVPGGETSP